MENKGKLIVLEGACDGVGKSTQLKLLKDELKKEVECVIPPQVLFIKL